MAGGIDKKMLLETDQSPRGLRLPARPLGRPGLKAQLLLPRAPCGCRLRTAKSTAWHAAARNCGREGRTLDAPAPRRAARQRSPNGPRLRVAPEALHDCYGPGRKTAPAAAARPRAAAKVGARLRTRSRGSGSPPLKGMPQRPATAQTEACVEGARVSTRCQQRAPAAPGCSCPLFQRCIGDSMRLAISAGDRATAQRAGQH